MEFSPETRKSFEEVLAAVCYDVLVLFESSLADGKSVIHDASTTALTGTMEQGIFYRTQGDYCKTYGAQRALKKRS